MLGRSGVITSLLSAAGSNNAHKWGAAPLGDAVADVCGLQHVPLACPPLFI
jgi:hypothetical protein